MYIFKRKGSLIVDFDLIISDDPVSKIQVVDTVYKLVNGLVFVNYSGEVVNVTSASINSSAGTGEYGKTCKRDMLFFDKKFINISNNNGITNRAFFSRSAMYKTSVIDLEFDTF